MIGNFKQSRLRLNMTKINEKMAEHSANVKNRMGGRNV